MIINHLLSNRKYNCIYLDPPWSYENKNTGGTMKSGSKDKYKTMSLEEIKNLPINEITEKNAVIFMWATIPLLPEALEVFRHWKIKYKTSIIWRKANHNGLGFWFRGQIEIILVGIKGRVKAFRCQEANFIQTGVLKHSEKPLEFKYLIERATKNIENRKMLEMFARKSYDDEWDYWGDELKR